MQAYQAIKMLKIDRKEFLATHGLKSHMSKLPDSLVEELFGEEKKIQAKPEQAAAVDTAEADVVGADVVDADVLGTDVLVQDHGVKSSEVETCPYTERQIRRSVRLLGGKSPAWKWRHILDG